MFHISEIFINDRFMTFYYFTNFVVFRVCGVLIEILETKTFDEFWYIMCVSSTRVSVTPVPPKDFKFSRNVEVKLQIPMLYFIEYS